MAGRTSGVAAAQAERSASLIEAEAIAPEEAELAAVWHRLPAAVRAGIVAMVRGLGRVTAGWGDEGPGTAPED